jgi:hypothetical protein
MKKTIKMGSIALAAMLAGCDQEPELTVNAAGPMKPPEQVCAQARQAMEKLESEAGLQSDGKGGATIMEEAWLRLDPRAKEQMIELVGYDSACRASQPSREQNVTIRSEYGRPMVQQVVETGTDFSRLTGG